MTTIQVFTTGGTIDKIYFDRKSEFQVGESPIPEILENAHVTFSFQVESLFQKDSLDINDADREKIREQILQCDHEKIVITHGTDTMVETAKFFKDIPEKTIVLTGSLYPARFQKSDALYNIAAAFTAVQVMKSGVYVTMNGQVFDPDSVWKNMERNRFEKL